MKIACAAMFAISALAAVAAEPQVVLLWPNGAPGSEGQTAGEATRLSPQGDHIVSSVHRPSITAYLPVPGTATGAAVVIAPGGGHSELWVDHEGYNVAKWLAEHGVAGFVLKYRLAREKGSTYTVEATALGDTQRAIRLVKSRAAAWGVLPDRVGVMGFSAGGELAALAGTRFDDGTPKAADPVDREGSRPAFMALLYPAIPKDMRLSKDTPPAFLACGENDRTDISQGLPQLYLEMKKAGISAELHVYSGVGHGFGLRETTKGPVALWPARFLEWMGAKRFLAAPQVPAQALAGAEPTFEVASIKLHPPDDHTGGLQIEAGRFTARQATLKDLIMDAYGVRPFEISGGPSWMDSESYDVIAKANGEPGRNEVIRMLAPLLEDRFKLKIRREKREGPVYNLVVAKGGIKIPRSDDAAQATQSFRSIRRATEMTAQKMDMSTLAVILSSTAARPVIDQTGLVGGFDLKLAWTPENVVTGDTQDPPVIFTALEEQLGLKLESARGQIQTIVVESAEKPSSN